jgi:oligopeptide/dipeptide ABC transporter ATP-binding protein
LGRSIRPSGSAGIFEPCWLGPTPKGFGRSAQRKPCQTWGLPDPVRVLRRFPHQLSGGMLQRVLIAMVLALAPEVIIADEPTTNLDNIVERQILELFGKLQRRLSSALLFITHDMTIAAQISHRLAVMYAGQVVETGPAKAVLHRPLHPYTRGLIETADALERGAKTLTEIPGQPPSMLDQGGGCAFLSRCALARPGCELRQGLRHSEDARLVRCLLYD